MKYPPIQIVDENDNPIGETSKEEIHKKGFYHRIVRIMIQDEQERILIQKRSKNMKTAPGLWDHSAAGHVDSGETYIEAAIRETKEEIGLTNTKLTELGGWKSNRITKDGLILNRFNKVFKGIIKSDQKLNADSFEVTELKWLKLEELKKLISDNPQDFTSGLAKVVNDYY